ncbi:probable elongation factor 1-delta isoform X2 [Neodiprion virginianus]|uniref:probable elongation factor 1-delta isoform X2 n=1 Tax=Neodiprion fabricii TaxID=2872261 RepID=UPI00076FCEF7|nr:probable elongation factor 1-delta isoform X2 [Neodiprion fabricii]XP_046604445.1 probable elongation factor 1-delta isoform X2 [Neodiprion virginianus]
MATTPLAQEKVWFEKPMYDKAECLHFERLAKPAQSNELLTNNGTGIRTNCNNTLVENVQNQINPNLPSNTVSKKSKKNKSPVKGMENTTNFDKIESVDDAVLKAEDLSKFKPKEAKEKKNKADKKHANKKDQEKGTQDKKPDSPTLTNKGGPQLSSPNVSARGSLANEVAKIRQHIKQSLQCVDTIDTFSRTSGSGSEYGSRIVALEKENQEYKNIVAELKNITRQLEERVKILEERLPGIDPMRIAICPAKPPSPTPAKPTAKADDDDDVDLFGSDSEGEDEEAAKVREERLAAYAAKKSKKPALIAKSNIILDVKPWDDETDMKVMETEVRKIETEGLLWGAAKLVPLAYGIQKLQISSVVEDEKVSVDWLTEQIEAIEDYVQSVDIAAFNKI